MVNPLTEKFLKNLLYQTEGNTLDFKREQYAYYGGTDEQKSKLLKDILAFANAFRTEEAYIVIGVEEEKNKKHTVLGCQDHLNDSDLQQFVNSKTNRIVTLAYEIHLLENQPIGIIRIPKQQRPVYLKDDFSKLKKELKKEVVYYRLGSATDIANPDLIYEMGRIDAIAENQAPPLLKLQFADANSQGALGTFIKFKSAVYKKPDWELGNALRKQVTNHLAKTLEYTKEPLNQNYWRELEEYTRIKDEFRVIRFLISNDSSNLAKNIHLEIINNFDVKFVAETKYNISDVQPRWERFSNICRQIRPLSEQLTQEKVTINPYSQGWKLMINVGDIKPQSTVWTEPFYLAALTSKIINFSVQIYGDNLPKPENHNLKVKFDVTHYPSLTVDDLRARYNVPLDIM
ncbi:putative transcriptional regulator (plasmid) [Gloeothece citriformis PCC 7424]|uniref:Putative transcriptional regulator n=1 Tax=Gloeothece citriformis (strain PCC 7424) TaxID=65393 RepID=B7KMI2_GLOC7|nr:ATP-binding protein [Gloeothece citriformis]ACK74004.1 putative transcriptional regulator [Gloeothece citriformis PCC 7424]